MTRNIILCLLCSFLLSLALCFGEIPLLRKLGAGQNILHYVKEHKNKQGTPSMGGLGFVLAASAVSLAACGFGDKPLLVSLAVGSGYMLVGFLDDLMKKRRKDNLGLKPYQKIVFQAGVAILASLYCCFNGLTALYIPFTRASVDIGWGMLPLGIFVFIAAVNSVNLTDGLDGLAGSSCAVYFAAFAFLLMLQGGNKDLSLLCFCLTGALAAYLVFNVSKASVFMGDTGSLALGGFVACVSLFTGNGLILPIVGVMFVLSSITVIIQVIYYKKTGKRVFLMAPVHHHFQEKGFSEAKIAYAYAAVTAVAGALVLLPFA